MSKRGKAILREHWFVLEALERFFSAESSEDGAYHGEPIFVEVTVEDVWQGAELNGWWWSDPLPLPLAIVQRPLVKLRAEVFLDGESVGGTSATRRVPWRTMASTVWRGDSRSEADRYREMMQGLAIEAAESLRHSYRRIARDAEQKSG